MISRTTHPNYDRQRSATGYVSPCCGNSALPPAVNPRYRRFCSKCGSYYAPSQAEKLLARSCFKNVTITERRDA